MLALASPELEVRAITVAGGNAPLARTLANARGVVALAEAEVPVHAGAARGLRGPFPPGWPGHGADGMAGVRLPAGCPPAEAGAAEAIRALLRAGQGPITLVGIAPATNLATALAGEPGLAGRIAEIVLMSGAVGPGNVPGNGNAAAEFNAYADPEALAALAAVGRPLTLIPLEAGRAVRATKARIAALRSAGSGRALAAACEILATLDSSEAGAPLYDPLAVAWLIRPALLRSRPVSLTVDLAHGTARGRTVIAPATAPAHVSLLEPIDPDGVFALLAERLARLP